MTQALVARLNRERLRFYPLAIAGCTLVAWTFSQLLGPGLTDAAQTLVGADFAAFYTAGRFVVEGRGAELYDFSAQRALQAEVAAPHALRGFVPFISPPFCALLFAPFSWTGYATALLLWWTATLLALVASLHLMRNELTSLASVPLHRLTFITLLFFPTIASFLYGQTSAPILLIYTLTFMGLRERRDVLAGLALGLLAFKPQLAIGPILWMVGGGRWLALLGTALTATLMIGAGYLWNPSAMDAYASLSPTLFSLLQSGMDPSGATQAGYKTWGIQSLYGFAVLLVGGHSLKAGHSLGLVLSAVVGAAIVADWWRCKWKPGSREWDLRAAATLALGLVISPHLFLYDLMLLVLPLAIVWSWYPLGTRDRPLDSGPILAATAVLYGAAFIGSYICWAELAVTEWLGTGKMALQFGTLTVLLWAWSVREAASRPAS